MATNTCVEDGCDSPTIRSGARCAEHARIRKTELQRQRRRIQRGSRPGHESPLPLLDEALRRLNDFEVVFAEESGREVIVQANTIIRDLARIRLPLTKLRARYS